MFNAKHNFLFRGHLPLARKEKNCPRQSIKKERKVFYLSWSPSFSMNGIKLPTSIKKERKESNRCIIALLPIASSRRTFTTPPLPSLCCPNPSPRLACRRRRLPTLLGRPSGTVPPPTPPGLAVGDGASSYSQPSGSRLLHRLADRRGRSCSLVLFVVHPGGSVDNCLTSFASSNWILWSLSWRGEWRAT